MRTATRYFLRPMRLEDISQVMEIERESFPTMWPLTAFKRELQQNRLARYIVVTEHNPSLVVEEEAPEPGPHGGGTLGRIFGEIRHILGGDESAQLLPPDQRRELVIGFVGVWLLPDEAHIVTIAVRESHRRRGIGELLLISAIELAQDSGRPAVTLECRVSNEPALAMYEKYDFQRAGLRPRYYSDNHEDAYILTVNSVSSRRFSTAFGQLKMAHRQRWGDFETAGG